MKIECPKISVIMAVLKGVNSVEACIQSIVTQTYKNIELVIMDGGSTDGTPDILRRYNDRITVWRSEPDKGIYDAMNKGTLYSSGDRILFLGSDDLLSVDLKKVSPLLKDPNILYYGDAYWPCRQRLYDGSFSAAKMARTNICHQAIFYPRAVFDKYSFNLRYPFQADWELNMRCFSDPVFRFQYIPLQISIYNDQSGASSTKRDFALEEDYITLMWRHFPWHIALWRTAIAQGGRFLRRWGWKGRHS